ncbi:MAG: thioredoxin family protein [Microbacteriaceae bacterium]|nr:thioredoxin family protein [Microbacteriaceae bacterium]
MNRRTLIIVLTIAALIVAAVAGYAAFRPPIQDTGSNVSTPVQDSPSQPNTPSAASDAGDGAYVDYSPTAIGDSTGVTLLFFHATWCPSCRQIESEIISDGVPDGVTIIKVDYDDHQDLRQKYGVTIQTTFVKVDSSGNEIEKFVPYGGDLSLNLVLDALT